MAERARSGCLKFGCIGCVGIVGLALVGAGVAAIGLVASARHEPEFRDVDWAGRVEAALPDGIRPGEAAPGAVGQRPGAGTIELDVSMCRFRVEPAAEGQPLTVTGEIDEAGFKLVREFVEHDDGSWTLTLKLLKRGWNPFSFQKDGLDNRLGLRLPRGVPLELRGQIGIGETDMELGGLWVVGVDLDVGVGQHVIEFSDPLLEPMERLAVDASIGEMRLSHVGNASPREIDVQHNIGEVLVDLTGQWQADGNVAVRCGIGSCRVRMPRDVRVKMGSGGVTVGESNLSVLRNWPEERADLPQLTVSLRGRIGEVLVER